jgi:iron complex transport system ATP-binding protein
VLLLDEPTASLDLAHQHAVLRHARALAHEAGVAVLVILHDLNLALAYADDALLLAEGRPVASGPIATTLTAERVSKVFGLPLRLESIGGSTCFVATTSPSPPP